MEEKNYQDELLTICECEHNFIEISKNSMYITYKCTYCGYKCRKRGDNSGERC